MNFFILSAETNCVKKGSVNMKALNIITLALVIIGALNWGLIGFFQFNLVDMLFGVGTVLSRIVYGLVGIAGLYAISFFAKSKYTDME